MFGMYDISIITLYTIFIPTRVRNLHLLLLLWHIEMLEGELTDHKRIRNLGAAILTDLENEWSEPNPARPLARLPIATAMAMFNVGRVGSAVKTDNGGREEVVGLDDNELERTNNNLMRTRWFIKAEALPFPLLRHILSARRRRSIIWISVQQNKDTICYLVFTRSK
jgi:hypothetical protein